MTITLLRKEIKSVIKESVAEAIATELMKIRAADIPLITRREQKEIERVYRRPSRRVARTITID